MPEHGAARRRGLMRWLLHFRTVRRALTVLLVALVLAGLVASLDAGAVAPPGTTRFTLVFVAGYLLALAAALWIALLVHRRRRLRVERFNELLALTPAQF